MRKDFILMGILIANLTIYPQPVQKVIIYFPFNKFYLTSEAANKIDHAISDNTDKTIDSIKIYTYCDSIGTFSANDTLAFKRAAAVKNYLLNHKIGINDFKEIKGYGRRMPVNDNSTDSLRALNRRAEVMIFANAVPLKDSIRAIMQSIKAGEKFNLRNVNFYGYRHAFLPSALPILDSLTEILRAYPQIEIEIQGYVCCLPAGQEGYDQDVKKWNLSVMRAMAVYNYLLSKDISAKRLSYKGFGSQPLVPEINEDNKAINRRVEIKVLKR